jgi:hypothetical protein
VNGEAVGGSIRLEASEDKEDFTMINVKYFNLG